ncbi:g-D-glutamyl-meso-diaminopimelate peptidase [Butyrivibrio fibrisolvens DSM 3071]|uniref:G-D-glutamyl-meso-diaminopimelate peptidase n=1 Tax=Butyrivibrio fibrisolvens DSM 3071 TaxID=1121131 RepID=A0A1M6BA32_BUTFI|nr:g-D-glutamyl-meso-diaminopimelate peptidase [Butyrivibrio fibrisolvens DSM 3071]
MNLKLFNVKEYTLRKGKTFLNILCNLALIIVLVTTMLFVAANNSTASYAAGTCDIVSFSGTYTYDRMLADVQALSATYPDVVRYEFKGQTALGRQILIIKLGNPEAPRQILVHASIHGREYYVTPLVMKMAEYYAAYEKDLLATTCFTIVPMANPDGVAIAQSGAMATTDVNYQFLINSIGNCDIWKSNANGVDINRNFPIGWGLAETKNPTNSYAFYEGITPSSEVETVILEQLLLENNYDCYIAYHMRGNIIYYYAPTCSPEVYSVSRLIADTVHNSTGYQVVVDFEDTEPNGSFADFAQIFCGIPGCTVECGKTLPPDGAGQVSDFYSKNLSSWKNVANLYISKVTY